MASDPAARIESNQQAHVEANWLHQVHHFLQLLQMADGSKKAQDAIRTCGERHKKARKGTSASAGIIVPSARRRLLILHTDWVKKWSQGRSSRLAFTVNSIILRKNDALFQTCTEESSSNLHQTANQRHIAADSEAKSEACSCQASFSLLSSPLASFPSVCVLAPVARAVVVQMPRAR